MDGLNYTCTKGVVGSYTITFDNPMPNAEYSVTTASSVGTLITTVANKTANGFDISNRNASTGDGRDFAFDFQVYATNAQPPRGGTGADAWANTGGDGSLNGSFNLEVDLQPNGVFNYTFNNRMPDGNYGVQVSINSPATDRVFNVTSKTATGFTVQTFPSWYRRSCSTRCSSKRNQRPAA